ncbi:hypothetical protein [Mesorhizobium sp.]|uniref:hypothetical protein n=1 Tax=Mesorhizobium sp. TaxID=1871066 RepID=UPI000FE667E6|nr:hypothetical protein [Mesorhizobium sp.]RWC28802.1 MAG: hypothetical protein EOS27_17830 [Mesorhizobium sp.]TIX28287.1 MAG: hypothetical protein E5V35_02815 [Mesorhizobium sp.]
MKHDEPRGYWFSLPKPWLELLQDLRDRIVESAGEIRTYDGGHLIRVDGVWEVVTSGTHNDADIIQNALRKAN